MADSLRFKFAPGDKYSLVSVNEQKLSRMMDGNEWSVEQTTHLECDLNVEEVDENGNAWTRYTYKRVIIKLRSKDQKLDFDSDANESKIPVAAMSFQLALGESIYLRITPQGHIDKINGLPSLITAAKGKMGDFPGADMVSREIGRQYDEPVVRRTLEDQFAVFPDSNNEGATWTRKEVLSSADAGYATKSERVEDVNIVFEKTFRLNTDKSGQGGISVVDVNLIIQPEVAYTRASDQRRLASQSEAAGGASTKSSKEISGDGAGQIEIENATGRIINSKMTQDMVERVKLATKNQMLRPTSGPEPLITHKVMTFQMTKIAEGKPANPADPNEKGAPST
jgi:predicted regulator of Ras-like GTPase activity (Roadblock/LC7/MglB family)